MHNSDMIRGTRVYREKLLKDPYRPRYHFTVPDDDGRPGDPNGCFYADGVHHLMYLYRRDGGAFHWGHVTSSDLLHWRHQADSLGKGPTDEGCFSGGAFLDDDGTAYLSYWIFNNGKEEQARYAGIGLAMARPPYDQWERLPDPIISSTDWGIRDWQDPNGETLHLGCADPSNIWKKDGKYFIQLGNLCVLNQYGRGEDAPENYRGDWTELFSSDDLRQWTYEGRFYTRREDNAWTEESEDDMCPSFLPLPHSPEGGPAGDTMLQLFISHNRGCQYYLGKQEEQRFILEAHGRMSWKDTAFFAPESYIDGQGRQIQFTWLRDNLERDFETYGWSGVYSLPRTLWLRSDGTLGIAPIKELGLLRRSEKIHPLTLDVSGNTAEGKLTRALDVSTPDGCEVLLSCRGYGEYSVGVTLTSGKQEARIYYDRQVEKLIMDLTHSGDHPFAVREEAPLFVNEDETVLLNIFIDRSVLEVFAQDKQAISRRVYFLDPDDISISLFAKGRIDFYDIRTWEIIPTNPY